MENKSEIEVIRELNDDELDQVSGGDTHAERTCKYLPPDHGKFIEHYTEEPYFGQKVYVVNDSDREEFVWGTLIRSYECESYIRSSRYHEILIEGYNTNYYRSRFHYKSQIGKILNFSAADNTLYLKTSSGGGTDPNPGGGGSGGW